MWVFLDSISSNWWYRLIKRHWLTFAFLGGFITDLLLLDRIDDTFDNTVLFLYVLLATISLILFYVGVAERASPWLIKIINRFAPLIMQYTFGGLLSGMLIFYGRSGDLLASAPFLGLIILVIVANEVVTKRSDRLLYNVSVYFIGVFSYCVLIVPVWLGVTGTFIFYASGLLAVAITMFVVKLLKWVIPNFLTMQKRLLIFSVGCLYALFNGFYFFNFIPPIPLSLMDLDIYQSVVRDEVTKNYTITKVVIPWYKNLPGLKPDYSPLPGQGAACFAKVFAPAKIKAKIVHRWEYLDSAGNWQEHYRLAYDIAGDSSNGYRGFSAIQNIRNGEWRCSIENERGQVLGRKAFRVDMNMVPQNTVTVVE